MVRRAFLVLAVLVVTPLLVLGIEVQLARTAPRLDDEDGERPVRHTVRSGSGPLHVVWLGDSTTTGVGTSFEHSMAARVAAGLTEGPVEVTVLGESGARVHEVLDDQVSQLDELVRPGQETVVLVSVGANDVTALTRIPTFRSRYRSLVDVIEATAPGARVVLVGIPDLGTAPRLLTPLRQLAGLRAARLDRAIEKIARERRVHHVDLAARTSDAFGSDPGLFADDEYHPDAEGHRVWADAVLASLES